MSPQTPRNLPPILPSPYPHVALRSYTPPFLFPLSKKSAKVISVTATNTLLTIWLMVIFNHVLPFILWRFRKHFYVSCGISLAHACLTHGLLGHGSLFPFFVEHRGSSNMTENMSSARTRLNSGQPACVQEYGLAVVGKRKHSLKYIQWHKVLKLLYRVKSRTGTGDPAALPEAPGAVPSTQNVSHNQLQLQSQGIWCLLLVSIITRQTCDTQTDTWERYLYMKKIRNTYNTHT